MLRHLKKITCVLLAASLAASASGCSRFISDASSIMEKTYEKTYTGREAQMERSEEMMNKIISCVNRNDKTGLKDLFSEVAVKRAGTIDSDLGQLLQDFNDIKSAGKINCSAYGQGGDEGWYYLSCFCDVETSKGKMRLSWLDVPRKVEERSCEGLYSVAIMETNEIFYKTAGVYKADLGRYMEKGTEFVRAKNVGFNKKTEYLSKNLTDGCLADHSEEELLALEWFLSCHPVANYLKWTSGSGDTVYVFFEMYLNHNSVVLCAGYDKDDPGKITHISLADCDKSSSPPADTPSGDEVIKAGLGDVLKIYNEQNN